MPSSTQRHKTRKEDDAGWSRVRTGSETKGPADEQTAAVLPNSDPPHPPQPLHKGLVLHMMLQPGQTLAPSTVPNVGSQKGLMEWNAFPFDKYTIKRQKLSKGLYAGNSNNM